MMAARIRRLLAATTLVVAVVLAGVVGGGGAAAAPGAKALVVTNSGVGAVKLGMSAATLRGKGLIGGLRKGCPFDPGQRVAPLRAPLSGWATFGSGGNGLTQVTIEGGAETARHVAVGSTAAEARSAYPTARYQAPGTADPFAQGFLWVPSLNHPKMTFTVDPDSRTVEAIAVPAPAFCE
jgi:hypothetical protein